MDGKHAHKLMNVFEIAWIQQSKCTNRHGFHTRKFHNKTWLMLLNPAAQQHVERNCISAPMANKQHVFPIGTDRRTYTAPIHINTLLDKLQQAPMVSSSPPFLLIDVLVGNTHICIYVMGIAPAVELQHSSPSGLWSCCHWGVQAALEAQSLCNVSGNTLEIPV